MGGTVHFDDQLSVAAGKVGDEVADGKLAHEFVSAESAITQLFPEAGFCGGFSPAQGAGVGEDAGDCLGHVD